MRGDSIRDLYAKTAALAGLAVLAGIGALVDYWPIGVRPPAVAVLHLPVAAPAHAVAPDTDTIPVVMARVAAPAPRQFEATLPVHSSLPVVAANLHPLAELEAPDVAPPALPPPPVVPVFEAVPSAEPVPFVAWPDFDPSLVYQISGDEDSGLLSGAVDMMKTTGSTIARGGAITGASIASAFRAVSGAFKKLKLF